MMSQQNSAADPVSADRKPAQKIQLTTHNQYQSPRFLPSHLNPDPLLQFNSWFQSALSPTDPHIPTVPEPEAMCLGTVSSSGIPSSRIVLLKTVDHGFVFFTNYTSRKSREIIGESPFASLAFYWKEVSRQVRVVGKVEKASREETEAYFRTRPRESQVGAWASEQSSEIGEDTLEERMRMIEERFEKGDVDVPDHWGGWRIVPL
ncbi:MAG: hypothetical protein TREMPRED_004699 [Tremellales sp. Tagirdzhanova-0007]|nr:MAG: hypothetical protein TREMPRED_004699 [Tremellales sp. Tagirdzhanova-0007]